MKITIKNYSNKTQMICSGFRVHNATSKFTQSILTQLASHFSMSKNMFEIIIYDNSIMRDDETDESFAKYKGICTTIRDDLLKAAVHPEAMEISYKEWTFPKSRNYKDEKVKMAIHIKIHNHKVMRIGVVDKMTYDSQGNTVREKYPTTASMVQDLTSKVQTLLSTSAVCENSLASKELSDDEFKIIQAMALIDHATELIGGLRYKAEVTTEQEEQ